MDALLSTRTTLVTSDDPSTGDRIASYVHGRTVKLGLFKQNATGIAISIKNHSYLLVTHHIQE